MSNPRRRRRRNASMGGVKGMGRSALAQLKGFPKLAIAGLNVGAGYLVTGLATGLVDRLAGGRLGAFTGIAAALGTLAVSAWIPQRLFAMTRVGNKAAMQIGVALYGATQILKLVLPESIRSTLGLSDYVTQPGWPTVWSSVGGGPVSEYIQTANGMSGLSDGEMGAAAAEMAYANPLQVADAMLDAAQRAEMPNVEEAAMMGLASGFGSFNEYIQTGPVAESVAGLGHAAYNGGRWWSEGQYASTRHPEPPASRFLDYGYVFRGLGMTEAAVPAAAQVAAAAAAKGATPPQAVAAGARAVGVPADAATQMAVVASDFCGPGGACPPCGPLPVKGFLPSALPAIQPGGPIDVQGTLYDPYKNLI